MTGLRTWFRGLSFINESINARWMIRASKSACGFFLWVITNPPYYLMSS
jgi:hypothetical protein